MKRFKNILYYVAPGEGPSDALGHAFALARRNKCPLKLLSVVEPISRLMARVLPGGASLGGLIVDNQRAVLDGLASGPGTDGLEITTLVRRGRPFLEIIREVIESEHDLVMKSAQGTGRGSLGPTALHLMRKCPCPVWVTKPGTASFHKIVAAVDPVATDEDQIRLQRRIVELAKSLAEIHGAELSVVHAWDLPGESLLRKRMNENELLRAVKAQKDRALAGSKQLVEDMSLDPDCVTLIKGYHGRAIAEYLAQTEADLVVMGTLSRSGVPGLLIGNTAERILKDLHCSVLTLKPEGFVTPVTVPDAAPALEQP